MDSPFLANRLTQVAVDMNVLKIGVDSEHGDQRGSVLIEKLIRLGIIRAGKLMQF